MSRLISLDFHQIGFPSDSADFLLLVDIGGLTRLSVSGPVPPLCPSKQPEEARTQILFQTDAYRKHATRKNKTKQNEN